jgi:hypothetical protein
MQDVCEVLSITIQEDTSIGIDVSQVPPMEVGVEKSVSDAQERLCRRLNVVAADVELHVGARIHDLVESLCALLI